MSADFNVTMDNHLAKMMCRKLPQELRNMVYSYIFIVDKPIPIGRFHFAVHDRELHSSRGQDQTQADNQDKLGIIVPQGNGSNA